MKYSLIIVLLLISCYSYAQTSLLEKEITLDKHSGTIEQALKEISDKGGFYFTYSNTQIPIDRHVFFLSKQQKVKDFLDAMFKDKGVEYIERYNKIILKTLSSVLKTFTLKGTVRDKFCNDPIQSVNVKIEGAGIGMMTDINGNFSIQVPVHQMSDKITLSFSHIAYKTLTISVKKDYKKNIEADMEMNILNIPEIHIFGVPQIAYANTEFQIYDYEIFYDNILLIVYEKRLSKSNLLLIDKEMKVACIKEINGTPVGMYKDCIGDVNLITFYYPFKVSLHANCLNVAYAKQDWLNKINKPCVAQTKNGLFFYYFYGPARLSVDFSFHNPVTKTDSVFRQVKDTSALNELKDKLEKSTGATNTRGSMADIKVGEWDGDDKDFGSEGGDNKKKKIFYTPMLSFRDSLYIFNHCEGKIEVYAINAKFKREVHISYHTLEGWKKKIYLDKATNKVYTCFWKNGHYEMNEIDLITGNLNEPCKIHYSWIDKLQVFEGNVYFLYKPAQFNYKKCLYKQKL
ncbi:MAG: carboxypeptidase-like regulatory domain-containing protein [Bacteroidia bacterium]|nr:carboxypeptidase-like regulatory domain-containing protein [Bacteroidia bacterium]